MNTTAEMDSLNEARQIIRSAHDVWDLTVPCIEDYWDVATLRRFKEIGFTFVSATIEDFPATFDGVTGYIERAKRIVAAEDAWLCLATSIDEIDRGRQEGKLVLGINIQDTAPIETDISRLASLHALGVRQMLLAYNIRYYVADGCAETADAGLSNFGRAVVREMNRLGIVVDCSHTGRRSSLEAIEISERPTIFSHSGVYALCRHIRNLTDDQIRACAARGGVIGVVGNGSCLCDAEARPETMFRHIDYVVNLVGPEHVGIGTDYLKDKPAKRNPAASAAVRARMATKKTAWPDLSIVWPVRSCGHVAPSG